MNESPYCLFNPRANSNPEIILGHGENRLKVSHLSLRETKYYYPHAMPSTFLILLIL